ncbi:GNAT family N-acetyltransferase [Candidatus Dependentiae bacterium]|nr:GNAT family N-acetyltransferase [Candidatus Dependentiae bacterium]
MYRIMCVLIVAGSFAAWAMESPTIVSYYYPKHQALVGALLDQCKHEDEKCEADLRRSINCSNKITNCLSQKIFRTNVCIDNNALRGLVHYSTYHFDFFCINIASYARIEWIQVDKPGHGIGSKLLEEALETATQQNCKFVIADVPQYAHKAGKFFERNGFVVTKTSKGDRSYRHYLD